ncbi:hypothetical protein AGMMS50255_2760 [Spirochaetia bacterium]|nr:hypothetical protein AGMMS50255_2760 [Spirochaetia bacterium]
MATIDFNSFVTADRQRQAETDRLLALKQELAGRFPYALKVLNRYDREQTAERENIKPIQDYYLSKQVSKKLGFVYVIRYRENGVILPSHWSSGTNDKATAEKYAIDNRDRLIAEYHEKNEADKLYRELGNYYTENSDAMRIDIERKDRKTLNGKDIRRNYLFVNKVFIPFMKNERGRKYLKDIETADITALQNKMLAEKSSGQTINKVLGSVKMVFQHFERTGKIKHTPFIQGYSLNVQGQSREIYELPEMKNAFSGVWNDKVSFLLNLIIYTTGARNGEIESLRVNDITNTIDGVDFGKMYFLRIRDGKTENAKRHIPLPPFTYGKIQAHIKKTGKTGEDFILGKQYIKIYKQARNDLGALLGYTPIELDNMRIDFYSGRHFWKTAISEGGLSEGIEELWMGHAVSSDIKKLYNHKNRIGKDNLVKKITKLFSIIDKTYF